MANSKKLEMIIGLPKEIKIKENRVAMKPSDVEQLIQAGHKVNVQTKAGVGAGYSDEEYTNVGATIVQTPEEAYDADIVVKVKEPIKEEYDRLKEGTILYTYLHLAADEETKELTKVLLDKNITGIAYETVEKDGDLPLLKPMSIIAGQLAVDYGARFLQRFENGRGKLVGLVEGAEPTQVVVIGGGNVGYPAALKAAGTGAKVSILDIKPEVIQRLKQDSKLQGINRIFKNIEIVKSSKEKTEEYTAKADLLIGAVLIPGAKAPTVVTKEMIKNMKEGATIVDVSIDQGGCIWGARPTTHADPKYEVYGKNYCCITNMPGAVARTSTQALTAATFPYLLELANKGLKEALKDEGFAKGVNTHKGHITYRAVAKDLNMEDKFEELDNLT